MVLIGRKTELHVSKRSHFFTIPKWVCVGKGGECSRQCSTHLEIVLWIALTCVLGSSPVLGGPVKLTYAKNFSVEYFETHKIVTVRNMWRGSENLTFNYALVPRTAAVPDLPSGMRIIRTPVQRMSILETVYLGHIKSLDLYDELVGLANVSLAHDPMALEQVKSGYTNKIQEGSSLNIETLLMLKSDLVLTSAMGNPQFDAHPQLERAKQPVVITAGYMEEHPLGRSEWLKFTAVFFDKEEEASRIFDKIAKRYNELSHIASSAGSHPTVLANAPYGGTWHVPGGRSYIARTIEDAGGDYLFSDDSSSGGLPKDFESVYHRAAEVDFWLNPGVHRDLEGLRSQDSRFARFKAFEIGNVYNNTLRSNGIGGNDIWERGVLHPEWVLEDLIAIFHPELIPNHSFRFYEKLD